MNESPFSPDNKHYLDQFGIMDPRVLGERQKRLAMEAAKYGSEFPGLISPFDVPLEANAMMAAPVPILGDILGLAADAKMYATEPESRTLPNFALSAAGALPFVPNAAMFAGLLAKTADVDALAKAKLARAGGADPKDVWREHGWFEGPDGEWRFEIDDSGADFGSGRLGHKLSEAVDHSELFDAYPELGENYMLPMPDSMKSNDAAYQSFDNGGGAVYMNPNSKDNAFGLMIHELQHGAQFEEGFATGGSPDEFFAGSSLFGQRKHGEEFIDAYRRLAGEAEARAVQKRMNYTPEQRRQIFPLDDYDVPLDELIVRK